MSEDRVVVQLDKNWRIESDARSWNLVYDKTDQINPKTGNRYQNTDTTYHINLKQALVAYLEKDMADAQGVDALIARINKAEQNVEGAVDRLFKQMREAEKK